MIEKTTRLGMAVMSLGLITLGACAGTNPNPQNTASAFGTNKCWVTGANGVTFPSEHNIELRKAGKHCE